MVATTGVSLPSSELGTSPLSDDVAARAQQKAQARIDRSARKKIGILLLSIVVILWVSSSFLTYAIFSDDSYTKPYLVTYLNTSVFCFYLLPWATRRGLAWWRHEGGEFQADSISRGGEYYTITQENGQAEGQDKLGVMETMRLSAEFCFMWFIANYVQCYCLKWTSVASATILSCTSSIFTLILSALLKIERFTWTKLLTVFLSLVGISLISNIDFGTTSEEAKIRDKNVKTPAEILTGDGMALIGALSYSVYTTLLKFRVRNESRISMQMFLGFVGLFNLLGLWPGLVLLQIAGVEKFELPPDNRVWWIVATNAIITLVSDYCWAYAMFLTTPLIVTVGLSLTIPLALLGQVVLQQKFPRFPYWVGAALVLIAFLFINKESESLDTMTENEEERTRGEHIEAPGIVA